MGLIKFKHSKNYYADFRNAEGKRQRVSTGTANKLAAERFLDELKYAVRAGKFIEPDAEEEDGSTLAEFWEVYVREKVSEGLRSMSTIRQRYRDWVAPHFGEKRLSGITRQEITEWRHGLSQSELSPATVNRVLALMRNILNEAVEAELIEVSPFRVKLADESVYQRNRYLTRAEADRLIAAARKPQLKAFIIVAIATGARSGELLNLAWGDVDLDGGWAQFPRTKEGGAKRVALNADAVAAIGRLPGGEPDERVFGYVNLSKPFRTAVKRAGLGTSGPRKVTPHTLRHTCSTWLAWAGVSVSTIADQMGQTEETSLKHYQHAGDLHDAVARIEKREEQVPNSATDRSARQNVDNDED